MAHIILLSVALVPVFLILRIFYRIFFHPLSKYPGPVLAASSRLWYINQMINGTLAFTVKELHQKYGKVVRIAPDELSFVSSQAWVDIYGFRNGKPEMSKETPFFTSKNSSVGGVISAEREMHGILRKLMSRGFSEAALREQEPIVQGYTQLLIDQLKEESKKGKTVDMVSWYNFFTFDVIGDLAFGEPFGCLTSSSYHPWVKMIFDSMKFNYFCQALNYYPSIEWMLPLFMPKSLAQKGADHHKMTVEKVMRRKQNKTDRMDFLSLMVKPENGISDQQLIANSNLLIVAGSETTATALAACTWYLCKYPSTLAKLTAEIRTAFSSSDDITFLGVNRLKYLNCVLTETLRCFPSTPTGVSRRVPQGGDMIDGGFVAGGMQAGIAQLAANHYPSNFTRHDEFIPERFETNCPPEFANDDKAAMQSFSFGPRNCLGKNLAYVEMRLIIARILWEFDIEMCDGMENWSDVKIFLVWDKKPLPVRLTPVPRD
ncbi:cytochrome P450 [Botrytis cinerea]